jgi:hypothetical protein
MDETINTQIPEVKTEEPVVEVTEEKTLGEALKDEPVEEPKKETVGLDKFLDIKKQNKELKRELERIQSRIENEGSSESVSEDIESIAEEFNIDKNFLQKLEKSILSKRDKEMDEKLAEKLRPIEQERKQKEVNKVFDDMYNATLERMPEYANVIDQDVVRSLAVLKENATLSLPQLIEKIYGKSVSGRKTIETTVPRGGKEPQEIDFALASKDMNYFNEIMASPELKKKYNQNIESRLDL